MTVGKNNSRKTRFYRFRTRKPLTPDQQRYLTDAIRTVQQQQEQAEYVDELESINATMTELADHTLTLIKLIRDKN